jgi:hypothetical protein
MKSKHVLVAAMVVTGAMAGTGIWAGGAFASAPARGGTIRIDAVASQENFVDVDPLGPSLGDVLVLHDDWMNDVGDPVGYDGIVCTTTFIDTNGDNTFECRLTGHLDAGDLTAQGFFTEPATEPPLPSGVLAVTGGTARYAEAAGTVTVQEISEEETHLTFHLASP